MDKLAVRQYFDQLAPVWDSMEQKDEGVIRELLDNLQLNEGMSVLDVACGTGIMFPYYLEKKAGAITGIDISEEMLKRAGEKFPEIRLIACDAEQYAPAERYDRIMIYNAFPHFPDPEGLLGHLSGLLKPGGILSVAHGMSRQDINLCHEGSARHHSRELLPADRLAGIFPEQLTVTVCVDSDRLYQVCGRKDG